MTAQTEVYAAKLLFAQEHSFSRDFSLILLFFMLSLRILTAQPGFELKYPVNGSQMAWNMVENEEGFLFSSVFCKPPLSHSIGKLIRISASGDTISTTLEYPGYNFDFHSLFVNDSGNILVCATRYPDQGVNDTAFVSVYAYNSSLNFLWRLEKALPFEYNNAMTVAMKKGLDQKVIIAGNAFARNPVSGSRDDIFMASVNWDLEILDLKFIPYPFNEHVYDLHAERDSAQYKISADGFSFKSRSQLITLDSTFNVIRIKDLHEILSSPVCFRWKSPNKILMTSVYHKPLGSSLDTRINLVSLDHNFAIQNNQYWDMPDSYDSPAWRGGVEISGNSDYVLGGTFNTLNTYSRSWLILAKTDSLLNKSWQRFYGGDAHYFMFKMIAARDGGYVMAGYYSDTLFPDQQGVYILKVNADGLINTNGEEKSKDEPLIIYPNPAKDYLFLKTALNTTVDFELCDLTGRLLLHDKAVRNSGVYNVEALPPGIYICKCRIKGKLIHCCKIVKQ